MTNYRAKKDPRIRTAKKRVREKKRFYKHLRSYIIVNSFMTLFLFFEEGSLTEWAPVWIFWGMALAFHYFKTFGLPGTDILTPEWEERELQKELERHGLEEEWLDLDTLPERPPKEQDAAPPKKYREEDLL